MPVSMKTKLKARQARDAGRTHKPLYATRPVTASDTTRWNGWNSVERTRVARRFRHHIRTKRHNPHGRIEREACAFCRLWADKIEAHHVDYAQPFLVVWVCIPCHRKVEHGSLKVLKKHLRDYSKVVMQRPGAQLNTPF